MIALSEKHELTVFGTAEVKLTKKLDQPEHVDEMSDYVNNSDWSVQYTPEIDFCRCSCGVQLGSGMEAELHLLKHNEEIDKDSGEGENTDEA